MEQERGLPKLKEKLSINSLLFYHMVSKNYQRKAMLSLEAEILGLRKNEVQILAILFIIRLRNIKLMIFSHFLPTDAEISYI